MTRSSRRLGAPLALLLVAAASAGQAPPRIPAPPLTVISAGERRSLACQLAGDLELVALGDLASALGFTMREDATAGGITLTRAKSTVVLTAGQPIVSVAGRLVSLRSPAVRDGRGWLVPTEFIDRALALVPGARIDFRRTSRLVVLGDVRVPRVDLRQEFLGRETRVVLDVSPPVSHSVIQETGRLLVRFDADALDVALPAPLGEGPVAGVRLASGEAALIIDLGQTYASFRANDEPRTAAGASQRLVVDVMAAMPSGTPRLPPARTPAPGAAAEVPPGQAPPPFAPPPGLRTVAVDAGHGGEETGATGPSGAIEKNLTLDVARQLKAALEARLGVRVVLTREGDQTLSLDDRAATANNQRADLFVSLHANSAPRPAVRGAEVFFLSPERLAAETREAAAGGQPLPVFGGGTRQIDVILWEMAQARHLANSSRLAEMIEQELRARLQLSPRPVQQAGFRVLVGANMPAVLVEMGYLTNPDEERLLGSPDYQSQVVQALVEAIARFGSLLERGQ